MQSIWYLNYRYRRADTTICVSFPCTLLVRYISGVLISAIPCHLREFPKIPSPSPSPSLVSLVLSLCYRWNGSLRLSCSHDMSCINPLTAQLADRETAPTEVRLADTPLVCSRDAVMGTSDTFRQGTWKAGTHFARQEGRCCGRMIDVHRNSNGSPVIRHSPLVHKHYLDHSPFYDRSSKTRYKIYRGKISRGV